MMQTTARMKTKKKEPYIPITERARTGLYRVSDCWWVVRTGAILQSDVVLDAWASHEHDYNGGKKRSNTCGNEGLLPCLRVVSTLYCIFVCRTELTRPTDMRDAPVFQPTSENLIENQYSGRLYL
jgi:hypothetical protein